MLYPVPVRAGDLIVIRPLCTVLPFCVVRAVRGRLEIVRRAPRWIDALREPIERGEIIPSSSEAARYLNLTSQAFRRPRLRAL